MVTVILLKSIGTFTNINTCIDFLNDIRNEKAFLIISNMLNKQIPLMRCDIYTTRDVESFQLEKNK
jgi:hypothetical protein